MTSHTWLFSAFAIGAGAGVLGRDHLPSLVGEFAADPCAPPVSAAPLQLERIGASPSNESDEARFRDFAGSIGVILESWWRMQHERRSRSFAVDEL